MPLTVGAVKEKLRILTSDTSKDSAVGRSLNAARQHLQRRTRYDLEAQTGVIDIFERIQVGTVITLKHRPVATVTKVEARHLEQTGTWGDAAYDLVDASRGRLVLLGGALQVGWPPHEPAAAWMAYTDPYWPLVRVTYNTSGFLLPADLEDAVHALAAYWYQKHSPTGAKISETLAGVGSVTYAEGRSWSAPPWFETVIAPHAVEVSLA